MMTCITSFSTRPRFQCGIVQVIGFGKKVNIACNIVLLNKIVKNYWRWLFSTALLLWAAV